MNSKTIVDLCGEAKTIAQDAEGTDNARLTRLVADLCEWIKHDDEDRRTREASSRASCL